MTETRFSLNQWESFFEKADIAVGLTAGLATAVLKWNVVGFWSLLIGLLALLAFGLVLPRLCRKTFEGWVKGMGQHYHGARYVISAKITGWVCALIITGAAMWLLVCG